MRLIQGTVIEVGGDPPTVTLELASHHQEQARAIAASMYKTVCVLVGAGPEGLDDIVALHDAAREFANKFQAILYEMLHRAELTALQAERSDCMESFSCRGNESAAALLRMIAALRTTPSEGCESGSSRTHSESTSRCER